MRNDSRTLAAGSLIHVCTVRTLSGSYAFKTLFTSLLRSMHAPLLAIVKEDPIMHAEEDPSQLLQVKNQAE